MKNAAALYALQIANYLFPLLAVPYLLRTLGVAAFGEIAFTGAVVLAFTVAVDFSFNYTATARIAAQASDASAVSGIYSSVMTIKTALMVGATMLLLLLTLVVPKLRAHWELIASQLPMLIGAVLFPTWLFQGTQRLAYVTVFNVVSRVVTLSALFVWVHVPEHAPRAAAIQAAHYVIAGILAQVTARRSLGVRWRRPDPETSKGLFRDSARVFTGNLGIEIYARTPMILVGFIASPAMVGAFAVVQKIAGVIAPLTAPITQSVYPHLCRLADHNPGALTPLRHRLILAVGAAMSLAVLALDVLRGWVSEVLSGKADPAVMNMILLFSPVIVVSAVNKLLTQFVMALRRFSEMRRASLLAAGLLLVLIGPLTLWLEAYGAIMTTLIIEVFMTYQCLRMSRAPVDVARAAPEANLETPLQS